MQKKALYNEGLNTIYNYLKRQLSNFRQKKATPKAHPRHTLRLLPLLPSGPGGIHRTMLRGYQWSHQSQIIQEFFSIATPFIKLFVLCFITTSNIGDKILTARILNFAILVSEVGHTLSSNK